MDRKAIEHLLSKFLKGNATSQEEQFLTRWFEDEAKRGQWHWKDENHRKDTEIKIMEALDQRINPLMITKRHYTITHYAVAASILLFLTIGAWYFLKTNRSLENMHAQYAQEAVTSGTNAAILVLEDGTSVRLNELNDDLGNIELGADVQKSENGGLIYGKNINKAVSKTISPQHAIHIPKGGNFQITLSDGTKVWLNAQSSLTYPLSFEGEERVVSLVGEAYFEVAKDVKKPFKVQSKNHLILVTGTKFNVKAYADESMVAVTLAEGGVNVQKEQTVVSVKPGQQALSQIGNQYITCTDVDIENEIAWKNGYFIFDNQDITSVMNSLARWYNVEVSYVDQPTARKFSGTFSKSRSLDEVLSFLTTVGNLQFNKKEGRIYIMN